MPVTDTRTPLDQASGLWSNLPQERVKRREIETRPEYQPRNPSLIQGDVARFRQNRSLEQMVEEIVAFLSVSPENDTDPVWIVEIEGQKVLVDGHHRLQAYSRDKRQFIPAKVYRGKDPKRLARLACRLANVRGSRVQLHPHEIREAVWQTLRELTDEGRRDWEAVQAAGYSFRIIRSRFAGQPSQGTLSSMVRHLGQIRAEYLPEEGAWPTWKEYLKWLRQDHLESKGYNEEEYNVEKRADQLARKLEKLPPYVRLRLYQRTEELLGEVDKEEMKARGIYPEDDLDF